MLKPEQVRIKVHRAHAVAAFNILIRAGQVVALPHDEYLLTRHMLQHLQDADIPFDIIKAEAA